MKRSTESTDLWLEERLGWIEGYLCVAGIDEAGRGALAGPVVAACVIFPREKAPAGIADSKTLSPEKRDRLFDPIMAMARGVGVGIVDEGTIEEINILRATHQAMRLALANLPRGLFPDLALIDGLPVRPFPIDQMALVQGDSRSVSISAASIIAKVTRDRLMREYDREYPGYGFAVHKGYSVPEHLRALETLGPCALHRRTFRPVAEAAGLPPPELALGATAGDTYADPEASAPSQKTRRGRRNPRSEAS